MARRSLKPHLNQIRAWVRQGRTDAWIAHQLEISTTELREFRNQHELSPDAEESSSEIDLRRVLVLVAGLGALLLGGAGRGLDLGLDLVAKVVGAIGLGVGVEVVAAAELAQLAG
jgi:hypothetical protein